MDAKQFAWVALIRNGKIDVKHSYYGGYKELDGQTLDWQWSDEGIQKEMNGRRQKIFKKIKEVGVNWDLTEAPITKDVAIFEGTFSDASQMEFMSGVLILNDGTEFLVIDDQFFVLDAFEMMTKVEESTEYFRQFLTKGEVNV